MAGQYSYGYLKEAVRAHLDLDEDELEVMGINQRFHIFANEAMQHICRKKPKGVYFQFEAVSAFSKLVFDQSDFRLATYAELNWQANGLPEPAFATEQETADWYNARNIYLVGQVITMPANFISYAVKKAFMWFTAINSRQPLAKSGWTRLSDNEFIVHKAANYQIPYYATWAIFVQSADEDAVVDMPSDLVLTIPIYVAGVCLQQRNLSMAQAKRQEFELALSRCKLTNFLENDSVTPTFV
jgi:hypothetical protein